MKLRRSPRHQPLTLRRLRANQRSALAGSSGAQWNFADEDEAAPSWTDDLKDQALDLTMFAAFATLALVGFFKKSERLKWITMGIAVVVPRLCAKPADHDRQHLRPDEWNLPVFRHNMTLVPVRDLHRRDHDLVGPLLLRPCLRVRLDDSTPRQDRPGAAPLRGAAADRSTSRTYIKYGLLGATVLYFLVTKDISIYRYVEPFWMFSRQASTGMWIGLAVLLVATVFVRNLYCRFLCPVGAFLGLLSNLTVFRIKRWSECNTCKICEKTCEWGAIRGPKIVASECVRCDDCERLYMDKQKCPHWLILLKGKMGQRAKGVAAAGIKTS